MLSVCDAQMERTRHGVSDVVDGVSQPAGRRAGRGRARRVGAARAARRAPAARQRLQPLDRAPSAAGVHHAPQRTVSRLLIALGDTATETCPTTQNSYFTKDIQRHSRP